MVRQAALCALLVFSVHAIADASEVVISDDGRQIKLNADGTWQQLSQDRFATNAAGQRVRLHPDGTWSVTSAVAPAPAPSTPAPLASLVQEPVMFLSEASIVRRVIERAKSKHSETRMRFVLQVDNRTQEALAVPADLTGRLKATSSRGGDYEILSATPDSSTIPAGERGTVEIWAKDSPRWFGIKYLSVEVAPDTFGNGVTRILSKNMDEVKRVEVDQF